MILFVIFVILLVLSPLLIYYFGQKRLTAIVMRVNDSIEYAKKHGITLIDKLNSLPLKGKFKLVCVNGTNSYDVAYTGEMKGFKYTLCNDYHRYRHGKGYDWDYYTYCVLEVSNLEKRIAPFLIKPENLYVALDEAIFGEEKDIDFAEDQEFSKNFILNGVETDVRVFFTKRIREIFISKKDFKYCYEVRGKTMLVRLGKYLNGEERMCMLETAVDVFTQLIENAK